MKSIKNLVASERIVEKEFPGVPGFKIRLKYQGRQAIRELVKRSTVHAINSDMQKSEQLDMDLFNKLFVSSCVLGWTGLNMEGLSKLILLEAVEDLNEEVPFSTENAEYLISASERFDKFINATVHDLDIFR